MPACPDCGVVTLETTHFCPSCGRDNKPMIRYQTSSPYRQETQYSAPQPREAAKRFDQIFGIDPRVAFLAFVVDLMLFGTAAATMGITLPVLIPIAVAAGVVLGRITYKAQMKWYGDDHDSAMIKAGIIGLLTAIPVGIPAIVWVPSGLLGLLHNARKKLSLVDPGW
jgi:rRNA maturation protein Nop10